MNSVSLSLPGAVPGAAPDADVAAHYGDPVAEQRALERAAGWVDRGNRGVLRVTGPDRLGWLNDLTSQLVRELPPGEATEALVLGPHGHVEHHLSAVDDGTAFWAHVEPGTIGALHAYLDSMRFLLRVEVDDVTDSFTVLTLAGPEAAAHVPDGLVARRTGEEVDLFVPTETAAATAQALTAAGVRPAGMWAYEARRIAAHRPRLGLDTDDRTIPHETGWIGPAVHLDKGCYRGQETVARVHNLGRPPRRLVMLHLDGHADRLPAHGAPVEAAGRAVGFVGSAARHHELGPIALAVVKRNTPVDAELLADGIAAAQEVVVSPDTGANANITLRRTPRA
ncbi:YgfZ/GcvT domain-containing protein [Allonocardiopsis opalescens]|uniref:Aminomethyltransferase folate-binding domain-containing protein n=1 Tax=Allonocardiopsis opalescens TaxID=1144618 RepID=A0A2T0QA54_9ACTN|nr:glycine cleavage T C-terminal barrel domain-containing protein [Allonocardiopsis opalescens]PRY00759.1 hypothetical protein CLV72_102391 [Allonocardiopsis opalescens]